MHKKMVALKLFGKFGKLWQNLWHRHNAAIAVVCVCVCESGKSQLTMAQKLSFFTKLKSDTTSLRLLSQPATALAPD